MCTTVGKKQGSSSPTIPTAAEHPGWGMSPVLPTSCCPILLDPGVLYSITLCLSHSWDEDPTISSSTPLMPTLLRDGPGPPAAPSPAPHRFPVLEMPASPRAVGCSSAPAAAPVSWLPCTALHKQALSEECGAGAWPPWPAPHLWRGQGCLSSLAAACKTRCLFLPWEEAKAANAKGSGSVTVK